MNRGYRLAGYGLTAIVLAATLSCASEPPRGRPKEFDQPEAAAKALVDTVAKGDVAELLAIFGPEAKDLVVASDPAAARRNREVFAIAAAESWKLADEGPDRKTLIVGHEEWPFPIPLVAVAKRWHFDTAAGKEEVLARRIGRNELAAIKIAGTYVIAQLVYARHPRDGQPAGRYARTFRSDSGRQNGLYWPVKHGQPRSPLGDLVARAAEDGRQITGTSQQPAPFRGYYFKILTGQGASAQGGARDYVAGGAMTGGFALVAWPAEYDVTGVMTFVVSQNGAVYQKDLGAETATAAKTMTLYDPDSSWAKVQ
jgi:hypothetical protein